MDQLEYVLTKHNCSQRIITPKITVQRIEELSNFTLPTDYKTFLLKYQGFEKSFGNQYMAIWDIDELLEMNQSYEILEHLSQTLGIGSNMGGELIAIEYIDKNNYKIILAPFIGLEDKENHVEIGYSFTDFLIRLDKAQEWFR
jgi:hypothetical protein